jgi:hypothetical protein
MENNSFGSFDFKPKEIEIKEVKYHQEDGPAIEDINGDKIWYKNGKRNRDPAYE